MILPAWKAANFTSAVFTFVEITNPFVNLQSRLPDQIFANGDTGEIKRSPPLKPTP